MGERRAEDAVQVGALVAERQLQDVAAVAGHDPLRRPDELVELLDRVVVVVVVDARRSAGRPGYAGRSSARNSPRPVSQPLVDRGQEPRPDELLRSGRLAPRLDRRDVDEERLDDAERRVRALVASQLARADAVAQRGDRRRVEDDLALLGVVLGVGEVVDQAAGQHVDELDVGIADDEAAGVADRDRDLHPELDRAASTAPEG